MNFIVEQFFALSVVAHIAFFLTSISFFMKDILWLRVISIISSALLIIIGLKGTSSTHQAQVFWHFVFVVIHLWRASVLIYQRYILRLNKFEEEIYLLLDKSIPPNDLKKIISLGVVHTMEEESKEISHGEKVSFIGLVLEGEAIVTRGEQTIKRLGIGKFFGEFSFITGSIASADVTISPGTKFISWDQIILKRYLKQDKTLLQMFQEVLTTKLLENMGES